jgi:hypothetical protein
MLFVTNKKGRSFEIGLAKRFRWVLYEVAKHLELDSPLMKRR